MKPFPLVLLAATALSGTLGGCALGPNYHRPTAPVEQHFTASEGWTPATPADQIQKGAWWQVYNDSVLDGLERKVVINNQTVAAAEAVVRQSEASVVEQQAALWPTLGLTFGANRTGGSGTTGGGTTGSGGTTTTGDHFSAGADLGWSLDIWGKVRREIEQAKAQAQASKADLANATLSAQATLAITYFELRSTEEQQKLLQTTVDNYQKALTLTQNQYNSGVAQRSDVLQAQSQLATTKAQLQDLSLTRGQYLHAIAVLIGTTPDQVDVPDGPFTTVVPVVPTGVPSQLLQRRPDIAASERLTAAANANIGIAETAFFPTLSLSATDTASSSTLSKLFAAHNSTWSVGADVAEDLVYFPALAAGVKSAKAGYDEAVAQYRETVLVAFQGTEDNLLALRVLEGEQGLRQEAEQEARQAEQIELNDYKAGTVAYTSVITAQNTTLSAMISTLTVRQSRLVASVTLIEDLGGGWDDTELKGK